jgi:tetratricopeptide (TPR) repeat protein
VDGQRAVALLSFSEEIAPRLRGLDAKEGLTELEERYDELKAALELFVGAGRAAEAQRLATSLAPFWMATKRMAEGSALLDRALALPGDDDVARGWAFFYAGMLAFWQGDDDRSTALHEQALELGRKAGDSTVTALALGGLARIALRAGENERARQLCREAFEVTEGTDDRAGRSGALHVLGVAAQMAGDLEEARDRMSERLALMREEENYAGISAEAANLSTVMRQLGNLAEAEVLGREALEIDDRRRDEIRVPWELNILAAISAERGEHERAAKMLGAAEAMIESQGAEWPPDEVIHYEKTVASLSAATSAQAYEAARAAGRAMSTREIVDYALTRQVPAES